MDKRLDPPRINQAVRTDIENAVLCWLATVDAAGTPNVTPKEIFSFYGDDHIVVADIDSSNTVRNVRNNPAVCVSFIDVFRQRGFKIVGTARVVGPESPEFFSFGADLLRMAGEIYPIRHVIAVRIKRIGRILAPSYKLLPNQSEDEREQQAYATYGVVPRAR
jgi:uncharacterized protein